MTTLAQELEELEARRAAGTITEEDAALAREALLDRLSGAGDSPAASRADAQSRGPVNWILAGVVANLLLTLVALAALAAIAYWLLPLALALPLLVVLVFILPVLWLVDWIGDLF